MKWPCPLPTNDDEITGDVGMETIARPNTNVARSESVLSKGSVVDRLFKMASHATKEDKMMAEKKYQSMSGNPDDWSDGSPPMWDEELFVTCASFGDVADDEDISFVESVRIIDGPDGNAMVSRGQAEQFNSQALRARDDYCTDNMDMLCINKDDVMDEASQILMDSQSWDKLIGPEGDKNASKKSRFGWLKGKSKNDVDEIRPNDTLTVNSEEQQQPAGVEMVFCGACGGEDDGQSLTRGTRKHSSSWTPRLVRRTRLNKDSKKAQKYMKSLALAEQAATEMDVAPLVNDDNDVAVAKDEVDDFVQERAVLMAVDAPEEEEKKEDEAMSVKQSDDVSQNSKDRSVPDDPQEDKAFESIVSDSPADDAKAPSQDIGDDDKSAVTAQSNRSAAKDPEDDGEDTKSTAASVSTAKKAAAKSIGGFMKKAFSKSKSSTTNDKDVDDTEDAKSATSSVKSAKSAQASVKSAAKNNEEDAKSVASSVKDDAPEPAVESLKSIPVETVDEDRSVGAASVKSTSDAKKNAAAKSIGKLFKKAFAKSSKEAEKMDGEQSPKSAEESGQEGAAAVLAVESLKSIPADSEPSNAGDDAESTSGSTTAESLKSSSEDKESKSIGKLLKSAFKKSDKGDSGADGDDDVKSKSAEADEDAKSTAASVKEATKDLPETSDRSIPAQAEKTEDDAVEIESTAGSVEATSVKSSKEEKQTSSNSIGKILKNAFKKSDKETDNEQAKEPMADPKEAAEAEATTEPEKETSTQLEAESLANVAAESEKMEEDGEDAKSAAPSVKSASTEKKNAAAKSIGKLLKKSFTKSKKDTEKSNDAVEQEATSVAEPETAVEEPEKEAEVKEDAKPTAVPAESTSEKEEEEEALASVKSSDKSATDTAKKAAATSIAGFVKKAFSKQPKEPKPVDDEETKSAKSAKSEADDITPPSSLNMSRKVPTPPSSVAEEKEEKPVELKSEEKSSSGSSLKGFFGKKSKPTMVDKGTQTGDSLNGDSVKEASPDRAGESNNPSDEPLRRTVSEDYVGNEDGEEAAPKSKLGFLNLRRISSDVPKTDLNKKKHKLKNESKPFEVDGHLSQPCPSDITDGTGDEDGVLKTVKSQEMETIDETSDDNEASQPPSVAKANEQSGAKAIDEKSEGKGKSASVTFGSGVIDFVRRMSSDIISTPKTDETDEKQAEEASSEPPKESAPTDDHSEEASVSVAIDGSITEEKPEVTPSAQEEVSLQATDGSGQVKKEKKNLLGSIGSMFSSSKKEGEETTEDKAVEEKVEKEVDQQSVGSQTDAAVTESKTESNIDDCPASVSEEDKSEVASSTLSLSSGGGDLKETVVMKKKSSKRGLKFWKRKSSSKKEAIKEETVEESKYDSAEENSRGGGSERDGPASDNGRDASPNPNDDSMLMKLKSIDVPEVSNPKFEKPLTQEEGLKQMQSMRVSDPALVEKCLDDKLKGLGVNSDDTVTEASKKSKKKGLESILKKNNRFSGAWRKKQQEKEQDMMIEENVQDDVLPEEPAQVAAAYGTLAAGADEEGFETGFEIAA